MSPISVRRLTTVLAILAVLCLAMPAAAAPAAKSPAVHGSSLLDQFLGWVGSWFGPAPVSKAPAGQKVLGISVPLLGGSTDGTHSEPVPTERGAMIDPNG